MTQNFPFLRYPIEKLFHGTLQSRKTLHFYGILTLYKKILEAQNKMYGWGLGYTNGYIPTKKKGIRKGRKIIEEEPGLTVSIYGEVYDFCQGIAHSRLTHLLASKSKLERCMVWSHFSCVWSCSETLRWRVVCKSEYSCYFIIVVMSYVVRNTSCWNQAGATERTHSHLKLVFHSCNHPKELLAEDLQL